MGLLTDTTGRKRVILSIMKYGGSLSVIGFLVGIIWMALLANIELNAKNYFSENQLLPGMAQTYFSNTNRFYKTLRNLQQICQNDQQNSAVREKIKEDLLKLNLDVYTQNFYVQSKGLNGTNIYGIYRSPRASGVESIVLNIPNHGGCNSTAGISLMLSLAKFFHLQTYWAKDIVFLLTEHNVYGMKAWLQGYFEDEQTDVRSERLEGHAGSIQAALTVDLESENVLYFDISIHGMNGMQPNLDLVHLLVRLANYESVPVKLEFQNSLYVAPHDFKQSLDTLMRTMSWQISGIPYGNHGLFYKYRIEAYTLKGISSNPHIGRNYPVDFESIGRYIEGVFRSINNLLEHIHQSFFMYLLPNTNRYISIGLYIPPLACLVFPLLVCLLQSWISLFQLDAEETDQQITIQKVVSLSKLGNIRVFKRLVVAFGTSWAIHYSFIHREEYLSKLKDPFVGKEELTLISFILNCVLGAVFMRLTCGRLKEKDDIHSFHFCTTIGLTTLIILASIFNFPAAFFVAALYVPVIMTSDSQKWLVKFIHILTLILSMPPIFLLVTSSFAHLDQIQEKPANVQKLYELSLNDWSWQMNLIQDYDGIGLWTWKVFFIALLPIWLMLTSAHV